MVGLVNKFAAKLEEKKGALSEDEVISSGLYLHKKNVNARHLTGWLLFEKLACMSSLAGQTSVCKPAITWQEAWLHFLLLLSFDWMLQTIQFKSYLLSVGIANPVTRETHGSGSSYHKELSKQLATFLEKPLKVIVLTSTVVNLPS